MKTRRVSLILVASLIVLGAWTHACTGKRAGTVTVAGSRSVLPVVQELADHYKVKYPDITIDIQGIGSSAGIAAVQQGAADIGMSSRNLKETETGLEETVIAIDCVALIVNPQNKIAALTSDQIRDIFAGETTNWSTVGGDDVSITVIDKEAGSGTREVFEEILMGETKISELAIVMDGTGAARAAVARDPAAIGYISLASVTQEVEAIALDQVEPSTQNVQAGKYMLFRPFVLATTATGEVPKLARDFIDYILSEEGQSIVEDSGLIRAK